MKIMPLTIKYNLKVPAFGSEQTAGTSGIIFPLKGITSKTAQKLYSLDYTPISKPREGYFLTYVLNTKNSNPVDIYVKRLYSNFRCPKEPRFNEEKYLFYREIPDGNLKLVGTRWMTFDMNNKIITPGRMDSYDKTLMGVGLREQQVTAERMIDLDFKNIEISSLWDSYGFHKKCGFQAMDDFIDDISPTDKAFIEEWSDLLKTSKDNIVNMIVVNEKAPWQLNMNKTLENFTIYLKNAGKNLDLRICIDMELTDLARLDWNNIARAKSVFHGKLKELR